MVLAIIAILTSLTAATLLGLRQRLSLEEAAQTLSQDIQQVRAQSRSTGSCDIDVSNPPYVCQRLKVTGTSSYVLEVYRAGAWQTEQSVDLEPLTFSNTEVGDSITFDTRGYAYFSLSSTATDDKPGELRLSDGDHSYRIIITIVGGVRIGAL